MLNDAMLEVEKLNAVQQLTATITPSSTVSMIKMTKIHVSSARNMATKPGISLTLGVLNVMNMVTL